MRLEVLVTWALEHLESFIFSLDEKNHFFQAKSGLPKIYLKSQKSLDQFDPDFISTIIDHPVAQIREKICYTNGFLLMLEATTNRITIYLAYSKFEPLLKYVGLWRLFECCVY